jgi:asparagine synthetase B (glutamine-hydrolysing)
VRTFTLRFEEAAFDELRNQRGLDDFPQFRLIGHRSVCRSSDLARVPQAIWHAEDMLGIGPVLGLMLWPRPRRRHVKVIMTGEGSDELFGGYSWYPTMRVLAPVLALPQCAARTADRIGAIRRRWPGAAHLLNGAATMGFERYFEQHFAHAEPIRASRVLGARRAGAARARRADRRCARRCPTRLRSGIHLLNCSTST